MFSLIPVWLRQLKNENVYLVRELPDTAKPYRPEFHQPIIAAAE